MRVCGSCGAASDDGFRYCGSCGTLLGEITCPSCAAGNPPGHRFCGHCGSPLTAAPAPSEERKVATVLFADLVGFTGLAEDADPEAVAARVEAAFRQMAAAVTATVS